MGERRLRSFVPACRRAWIVTGFDCGTGRAGRCVFDPEGLSGQKRFFRRKTAIPRTVERRTHRRTCARVIPDDNSKIAASDAWRLTLEKQLQDPPLRVVHESITASSAA
eukprot:3993761-Pleurochrysis_carterae.AAC.1